MTAKYSPQIQLMAGRLSRRSDIDFLSRFGRRWHCDYPLWMGFHRDRAF